MAKLFRLLSFAGVLALLASCAGGGAANPIVGTWNTVASTPLGDQEATWTIAADGTGVMSGDAGDQPVSGIMMDGNNVSFEVSIDAGGQTLNLSFSGVVEGDSLSGEFESDFGAFAVTGTRQ